MNGLCHNGLLKVLEEAEKAGFSRGERHQISLRYANSLHEYTRYNPRPTVEPLKTEWAIKGYEWAAEKARGYMRRHS